MSESAIHNHSNDTIARMGAQSGRLKARLREVEAERDKLAEENKALTAKWEAADKDADELAAKVVEYEGIVGENAQAVAELLQGTTLEQALTEGFQAVERLAKIGENPSASQARILELEKRLWGMEHRSKFDAVAKELGFRDDALDDLRALTRYEPDGEDFDADAVKGLLEPHTSKTYFMRSTDDSGSATAGGGNRSDSAGGAVKPRSSGRDAGTAPNGAQTRDGGDGHARLAGRAPIVERGRPETANPSRTVMDQVDAMLARSGVDRRDPLSL